jgi:nitrate/nitrite transport system substrate-binding protein
LTDAKKYMQETNAPITAQAKASTGNPKFKIMGKEFDPGNAAAYSKSFAISKG